jgi:anti-sigma factor RsiW
MTCQELVELVTDYFEGALPPDERERLEAHLESCRDCVAYVGQMRTTIAIIGRLKEDELREDALP